MSGSGFAEDHGSGNFSHKCWKNGKTVPEFKTFCGFSFLRLYPAQTSRRKKRERQNNLHAGKCLIFRMNLKHYLQAPELCCFPAWALNSESRILWTRKRTRNEEISALSVKQFPLQRRNNFRHMQERTGPLNTFENCLRHCCCLWGLTGSRRVGLVL